VLLQKYLLHFYDNKGFKILEENNIEYKIHKLTSTYTLAHIVKFKFIHLAQPIAVVCPPFLFIP